MIAPPGGPACGVVCTLGVPLRTSGLAILFALSLAVASAAADPEHAKARRWMAEAEQTTNPIRLLVLALNIRESLEKAMRAEPDDLEVRLDLVRFHVRAPRIAGGDMAEARRQAAWIATRDEALGQFANGYIAYREKSFGAARIAFRAAIEKADKPSTKALAMRWLGWLSQESQQWADAFAMFTALGDEHELRRTEGFCRCVRP